MSLELDEAVMDKLAELGFDPVYGARPLKRVIQQYLENPLAQQLLSGQFSAGDTIAVNLSGTEGGEFDFSRKKLH